MVKLFVHNRFRPHAFGDVFLGKQRTLFTDFADNAGICERNQQAHALHAHRKVGFNRLEQSVNPLAGSGADADKGFKILLNHRLFEQITLVEHGEYRSVAAAEGFQQLVRHGKVHPRFVARRVAEVDDDIGLRRFLQGRAERLHQMMRQPAHQSDGVNQHDGHAAWQLQGA